MYQHTLTGAVIRLTDGASIPPDPSNADYQRYLADVEAGAEVLPADPASEPDTSDNDQVEFYLQMASEESPDIGVQILVELFRFVRGID